MPEHKDFFILRVDHLIKFPKNFDLGSTVIFYQGYKKDSTSTDGSISLDPSYAINDKLSIENSVALSGSFGDSTKYAVSLTPSIRYAMNDDLSATLEYESNALRIVDGKVSAVSGATMVS